MRAKTCIDGSNPSVSAKDCIGAVRQLLPVHHRPQAPAPAPVSRAGTFMVGSWPITRCGEPGNWARSRFLPDQNRPANALLSALSIPIADAYGPLPRGTMPGWFEQVDDMSEYNGE